MKWFPKILFALYSLLLFCNCSQEQTLPYYNNLNSAPKQLKYLALGDSYTIGQNVCDTCRFPEQLKSGIHRTFPNDSFSLKIIATTGWTTTNLINAINTQNPTSDYDLVTLLIGVNNQYQHKPFALYEQEFPQLVDKAVALAKGDKTNVIVVSIPDYAFTPYGHGAESISSEIAQYNTFAQEYCNRNQIEFVDITDITQQGLMHPELVASDGLHPSGLAYAKFVERIFPKARVILTN
ncbi:SGNH/GDSL hydrolase family protein [Flavobacterium sp.]|uniref:SGNH/GDSL hydrolase family protein n=1 Tax=Flavobacterium sp. TaxID=239 RepID=UPI00286ADB77|nr:SGNH/GDSL hydrolase family protein [Flavobacterium sp.]